MENNYLGKEQCRERQIKILKAVCDICDDNSIPYYICFGTLLGAVRHKGYIPWDDDIDIVLFRKDYIKLKDLLMKQTKYEWLDYIDYEKEGYYYTFAKAVDNSTVAKQDDNKTIYGIWVDIFPLDNIPDDKTERNKFIKKLIRRRAVIMSMTTDFKAEKRIKHVFIKRILHFYSKFINKDKFLKNYLNLIEKYNNQDTKYVGLGFSSRICEGSLKKEWFKERIDFEFENNLFKGPKEYDDLLKHLYGNYMELPPIDKRRDHKIIAWIK